MTPAEIPPVAVDTNILFSALLQPGNRFLTVLARRGGIYVTETVLTELYRHNEKLLQVSKVGETDVVETYHNLITWLELYKEARIPRSCWDEAQALCHDIDPGDTVHVALALALDGLLWTGDKRLRDGLLAKGFDRFFVPW